MHMEAKVCMHCTFRKEEKEVVYILDGYMETVVCASFALICLCLVIWVV